MNKKILLILLPIFLVSLVSAETYLFQGKIIQNSFTLSPITYLGQGYAEDTFSNPAYSLVFYLNNTELKRCYFNADDYTSFSSFSFSCNAPDNIDKLVFYQGTKTLYTMQVSQRAPSFINSVISTN